MLEIRPEAPQDQDAVHRLNLAAFENGPEAALVDALRSSCKEYLAFVAEEDGVVVGQILFTPATVGGGHGAGAHGGAALSSAKGHRVPVGPARA